MGDLSTNPPIVYNPVQRYGTTADFLSVTGTISPSGFSHVLDRNNRIRHAEYVKEVADHPNYEAALSAARTAGAAAAH